MPTLYDLLGIDTAPLREKSAPGNYGRSLLPLITERAHGKTSTTPVQAQAPAAVRPTQRYRVVGDLQ